MKKTFILKIIIILFLTSPIACRHKKHNDQPKSMFHEIRTMFFGEEVMKPKLIHTTKQNEENISLEKLHIRNELSDDEEIFKFSQKETRNMFKLKNRKRKKSGYSPIFKIGLEDQSLERQPFEDPIEEDIITREATLELGFKTKEDFELFIKSNFANVSYDTLNTEDRFDIQFDEEIENISVGVSVSF